MLNGAVKAFERISIRYWRLGIVVWVILVASGAVAFGPLALIAALMASNLGFAVGFLIGMRRVLLSIKYWWLGVVAWVVFAAFGAVVLGPLGLIVSLMGPNLGFAFGLRIGIRQGLWGDL